MPRLRLRNACRTDSMRSFESTWSPAEREAVADLFADELARGWIPSRTDLEAALLLVRTGQVRSRPAPAQLRSQR